MITCDMTKEKLTKTEEGKEEKFTIRKHEVGYAFYQAFRRLTQAFLVLVIIGIIAVSALWFRL